MHKAIPIIATALLLTTTLCPAISFGCYACYGKPIAELDLMDDHELLSEAQSNCIAGARDQRSLNKDPNFARIDEYEISPDLRGMSFEDQVAKQIEEGKKRMTPAYVKDQMDLRELRDKRILISATLDYIEIIGRVARKKNGGKEPGWVGKVKSAVREGDTAACSDLKSSK